MTHILLIEDDDADAYFLREAMKEVKFENHLTHCHNGVKAQEFLMDEESERPAFILLDLNMPMMDGHEFLVWIKAQEGLREIPVGILTTSSAREDVKKAYSNYASYYITKPSTFEDLEEAVKTIQDFWTRVAVLPTD